jgi:hypothetical protein
MLQGAPPVSDAMTARPSRVDQQRCEALHPSVDGDVINLDASLGRQFLDVSLRQPESSVPAHA